MGLLSDQMELSGDIDQATKAFISQWENDSPTITAHTSGSTGAPKPIELYKADMRHSACATCRFFGLDSSSTLLSPLSADYIAGKMMIVRALEADCRLWIETPSNRPFSRPYPQVIDLAPIVPSQISHLLATNARPRNVIVGGGPIPPDKERPLAQAPFTVYATYGMTETCSHVALRRVGQPLYEAMPGVTFDTTADGRLIIIAPGYSFGSLTTNDLVDLAGPTSFSWLGRKDNVVISGGVKLHPEQIERKLAAVIREPFYLIGEPDDKWGQALIMYIQGEPVNADRLRQSMAPLLSRYEMPREIRFVPAFRLTPSGKIKRELL
jgi:O-succinylbenzoic acid--CoA ligase